MFFPKNKKTILKQGLFFVFFLSVGFVASTSLVHASYVGDIVVGGIKVVLYGVFTAVGWLASVGIIIFEWAINPNFISGPAPFGFFNSASAYAMWKFVRDFFNLFFILTLLYIAFTIVFQVADNYKKTLLSLVLAALFVNFSFPITRFMIDAANVPMYFFANEMGKGNKGRVLGTIMEASAIKDLLIPGGLEGVLKDDGTGIAQILMATIFLFIFSISLVILAVMFVIRLAALYILLIFSSIGFAASAMPGLKKFSTQWWDNFTRYALFGPAAMLMLYVTTRFFAETANGVLKDQFNSFAGDYTVAGFKSFGSAMAQFSIPIVLLWMSLGMAGKMSLAGGATVTGTGKKFAHWAKRKTYNNTWTRGIGKGVKKRAENTPGVKLLTPKFWNESGKKREERLEGYVGEGAAGLERVKQNQHNKKVAEEEKRMEEVRMSEPALRAIMLAPNAHDKETVEAAVRLLSKKDTLRNGADMAAAINAINIANSGSLSGMQEEKRNELIKKAGGEIYQNGTELAAAIASLGNDTKAVAALVDKASGDALDISGAQYAAIVAANPSVKGKLDGKLKKDGRISALIASSAQPQAIAIKELFDGMTAEDVAKQKIFTDPRYKADAIAYMSALARSGNWEDIQRAQEIRKKMTGAVSSSIP